METIDLKTGDIVFFRTPFKITKPMSWLSTSIRFFAKIKYNHVGIVICNWGVPFINEATEKGIISTPASIRLKGREKDILIRKPLHVDEKQFAIEANSFLGHTPYDIKGLISDQLVFNMTGKWNGAKSEDEAKKRFYCYEYYWYMFREYFKPRWWEQKPIDTIYTKFTY